MSEIKLEYAKPEDSVELLNLVRELAIYEKAENEVYTREGDFREGLETGLFRVLLAREREKVIGMALFYPIFSTWNGRTMYLEDFIVKNDFRGRGIGKLLFDKWLEICQLEGFKMLKWQVLDWNEPAKNFYKKYNSKFYPGWENGVIYLYDRT